MQCKHIPDLPILQFLAKVDGWATHFDANPEGGLPSVGVAMPPEAPIKLRLAKMGMLLRRGLVDGCVCGCRGDFEITDKGRAYLQHTAALPVAA